MCLAASQVHLLFLMRRKSDDIYKLSKYGTEKTALTREMTELQAQYNRDLKNKDIVYFSGGEYKPANINYFLGYGSDFSPILNGTKPLKKNNSMIPVDSKGRTLLLDEYANAIISVLGDSIMDADGRGKPFEQSYIPQILHNLLPGFTVDEIENGIEEYIWNANIVNTISGNNVGTTQVDSTDTVNQMLSQILDFYYPIFLAASANGWTIEYNANMRNNPDYFNDAVNSGMFTFWGVDDFGWYDESADMDYFLMAGDLEQTTTAQRREELTAKYDLIKAEIKQKEAELDILIDDTQTDLDSTKAMIESTEALLKDGFKPFQWCTNM